MNRLFAPRAAFVICVCALFAIPIALESRAVPTSIQQVQDPPGGTQSVGPSGQAATPSIPGTPPPSDLPQVVEIPPDLSVVLVIDISGSMRGRKLDDAKRAALESIARYLTPGIGAPPAAASTTPQDGGEGTGRVRPPAMSLDETARMERFRKLVGALEELQDGAGELVKWSPKDMRRMRDLVDQMDEVFQGLALEKKQPLLKRLNPLVERMHFAIATKVNESLGRGHKYMVSGKKSDHPDFGGLFANKMSDHDAIYVGPHANEAKRRHSKLASQLLDEPGGEEWLRRTDSAMESGELTFRRFRLPESRKEAFRAFATAAESNNDWMRTVSGGRWVGDYVVEKGEVIDLDRVGADPDGARRQLSEVLPDLKEQGLDFDSRGIRNLGYNLGAASDFDRQYLLNLHRQAQSGANLATASVLQKDKYWPRFQQMLEMTGEELPDEFKRLRADIDEAKALVNAGEIPDNAAELEEGFERFRRHVRERAIELQSRKYASIANRGVPGGRLEEAWRSVASELADDTQGAIHNYRQVERTVNPVLGRAEPGLSADGVLERLGGRDDAGLTRRVRQSLQDRPFVTTEPPLGEAVTLERRVSFGSTAAAEAAAEATRSGGRQLIRTAQRYRDYITHNPGTSLAYVAGLGWVGYQVYDAIQRDRPGEAARIAATFVGEEAAAAVAEHVLATRYGYAAGSGGLAYLVGSLSYAGGHMVGSSLVEERRRDRAVREASRLMSGVDDNGRDVGREGFLDRLGVPRPTEAEIQSSISPGQYGDRRIEVDPETHAVTIRNRTSKLTRIAGEPMVIDDWDSDARTIPYNELLSEVQLGQIYSHLRGEYRRAGVAEAGDVSNAYTWDVGGQRVTVANPQGVLTRSEFDFYRRRFDRAWGQYEVGLVQDATMRRAKADMFRRMMQSVVEGKQKDHQFGQILENMSLEELELMRDAVAAGAEHWHDGERITIADMEDRIALARSVREGALREIIDRFQESEVPEEVTQEVDVLIGMGGLARSATPGNVEFGVLAYEGSCDSAFWFHPFSTEFAPLSDAIESLTTGGSTPMSPALYQARWAIWTEGRGTRGSIVLLTDGENDCDDSPIEAAEKIYQRVDSGVTPGGGTPQFPGGDPPPGSVGPSSTTSWLPDVLFPSAAFAAQQAGAARWPGYHQIDMSTGSPLAERRRMPISVSAIGFRVNDSQQDTLDAIAAAGGGVSARADDLAELERAFGQAIGHAAGTPVAVIGGGGGPIARRGMSGSTMMLLALVALGLLLGAALFAVRTGLVEPAAGSRTKGAPPARVTGAKIDLALRVTDPDGATRDTRLRRAPATIGRDPSSDLVLDDPRVSRNHARIEVEDGRLALVDLGSSHGTEVDGRPVERTEIRRGSTIRLGDTVMEVG